VPIGIELESELLVLTKGRDFEWVFENLDPNNNPIDYPDGELFFEFASDVDDWDFVIDGSIATLKVESTVVDTVTDRTKWQLVFLPAGEPAGGQPLALGQVQIQGD
jgi:hypothetical protein